MDLVWVNGMGEVPLEPATASGGEGHIHPAHLHPEWVVKVYKDDATPPHAAHLIKHIAAVTKDLRGVCKVLGPAFEYEGGACVGLLMERVNGVPLESVEFRSLWDRLHFLRDLLRTLRELERRGLIYGDGNLGNVFRRNWTGRAVFIDIDSVSIVKPVAWPDGTKAPRNHGKGVESLLPPEVKGDDGSPNSSYTLAHVCAMYAWHVLSNNTHPCELLNKDGRPVDGMKPYLEQLECGRFGPSFDPQYRTPVEAGVPFASLPERLQGHFERSFSIGGLRDPMNRPLARQWVEAVDAWYSSLLTRRAAVASLCTLGIAGVAGELYRRLAGSAAPATKSTRQQAQETPAPPPPAKEERPRPTLWKLKTLEDRP